MTEMFGSGTRQPLRVLCCCFGLASIASSATAQTKPVASSAPRPAGILRIVSQRGEVLLDKGGNGATTTAPLRDTSSLGRLDEITTNGGSIELASQTGYSVRLSGNTAVALLGQNALYLARGDLQIIDRTVNVPGQTADPFFIATPCGRSLIKAHAARLRVEGNRTSVSVFDGTVYLGSPTATGAGITSGQSAHCVKGEALAAPRPIPPAPKWASAAELVLFAENAARATLNMHGHGHVVPEATTQRLRIDVSRLTDDVEQPISSTILSNANGQLEIVSPQVGRYLVRAYALDAFGAISLESAPHEILLTRVAGLSADGSVHVSTPTLPRINVPKGHTFSVLLDGGAPNEASLTAGVHKLHIQISGLGADLALHIADATTTAPKAAPAAPQFQGDSTAVWIGPSLGSDEVATQASPPASAPSNTEPNAAPARSPLETPGAEDVLFGGVGEVPFDGVRSPWARSHVGLRLESTTSGALRVGAFGRWTMRNGFGLEASASLVRAALANLPDGQERSGIGNINAAIRTPRLQTRHLALQGIVAMVAPISTSFLDSSVEQDSKYADPAGSSTALLPGARPQSGGWRVEPGIMFGVRVRAFSISTLQGVSLRVSPDFSASYAGGLLTQTEILPWLRFVSFATWEVRYLGGIVNAAAQTPDMGGAVGGELEALIAAGNRGSLRLALLGRAGVGAGGEAIYGRGAVGLQLGYLFH